MLLTPGNEEEDLGEFEGKFYGEKSERKIFEKVYEGGAKCAIWSA